VAGRGEKAKSRGFLPLPAQISIRTWYLLGERSPRFFAAGEGCELLRENINKKVGIFLKNSSESNYLAKA